MKSDAKRVNVSLVCRLFLRYRVPTLTDPRLMPQGLLYRSGRWHLRCPRSILVQPSRAGEVIFLSRTYSFNGQ